MIGHMQGKGQKVATLCDLGSNDYSSDGNQVGIER